MYVDKSFTRWGAAGNTSVHLASELVSMVHVPRAAQQKQCRARCLLWKRGGKNIEVLYLHSQGSSDRLLSVTEWAAGMRDEVSRWEYQAPGGRVSPRM